MENLLRKLLGMVVSEERYVNGIKGREVCPDKEGLG